MSGVEFDVAYALLGLGESAQQQQLQMQEYDQQSILNFRTLIRQMIFGFVRSSLQFHMMCSDEIYLNIVNKIDEALYYNANGDIMVYADPNTLNKRVFELISYIILTMYF